MNKLGLGLGLAAVVVGGAAVYLLHLDNRELRKEMTLLRTDVQMAARARARGDEPAPVTVGQSATVDGNRASGSELAELRKEIAALRTNTQEIAKFAQLAQAAQAVKQMEKSSESIATKITPTAQLRNAGRATPQAATETALWAATGGDVDALAGSLTFNDAGRARADQWFASLSDATRNQYGSAEKVIALLIAKDAAGLTGMQVLGQKELTADDVALRIRFASEDKTKDDNLVMHRTADGWRMLLNDQVVDSMAKKLGGKR
ncbi:MAG: hypothetical protein V4773_22670 [Verrucomicrobiota bacterium]